MSSRTVSDQGGSGIKVFAMRPKGEGSWLFLDDMSTIGDYLAESDVGDEWEVKITSLTRAEIDALPEFNGW
jgi:hypothetical protein